MSYFGELRANWRPLASATLGLACGYSLTNYTNNIFAPHLIGAFGWSRADFALLGVGVLLGAVCQPIAGRLTDAFGVRRVASVGVIASPLVFLAMAMMSGDFAEYYWLTLLQIMIVGGTTSVVIYSRLVAQTFEQARGFALGIASAAPAMSGAASAPLLGGFIDAHGWRAGFVAVAVGVAIAGVIAVLLIPGGADRRRVPAAAPGRGRADYAEIVRNPAFVLIMGGVLLCTLTLTVQVSQLKLVLLDRGLPSDFASLMISLYAGGVIVGRLLCGLALDRFPAHLVAAVALGLPCVGLGMLAAGAAAPGAVAAAVLLLGMALGGEGDAGAYLVTRFFRRELYSSVFGMLIGAIALSGAAGALLLSLILKLTGSFTPFLALAALCALAGGSLFLLLARVPAAAPGVAASGLHRVG